MFIEVVGVIGTVVGIIALIVGIIAFICFVSETNEKNRQLKALAGYLNIGFEDGGVKVIELPDDCPPEEE